ncbi:MAG: transposase [Chloroflexi bacterium]|nr:transposase [Chloroflexota bacterium]
MRARRSMRLPNYDYTQNGVYFVTICTYRFASLFGRIVDGYVQLNGLGRLVEEEWQRTAEVRPSVELDLFVVMPNHLHGLIWISHSPKEPMSGKNTTLGANSLGSIIAQYKSVVTKRSRNLADPVHWPIWKRNYYDHIVRNEGSLERIRRYILENPARWREDRFFCD